MINGEMVITNKDYDPNISINAGDSAVSNGQYEIAVKLYNNALKSLSSSDLDLFSKITLCYLCIGNEEKAREYMKVGAELCVIKNYNNTFATLVSSCCSKLIKKNEENVDLNTLISIIASIMENDDLSLYEAILCFKLSSFDKFDIIIMFIRHALYAGNKELADVYKHMIISNIELTKEQEKRLNEVYSETIDFDVVSSVLKIVKKIDET